ncbi:kinetochore protein NDC80 homolog [Scleropages formosus]|uniref:Kinetochore protein NDC80 n=1 Tax=Scleropages formosus TaxID=113540 RepID=A0A8C9V088_SCLFO|nr:kinetochore protein NDC80 homolog [Scleropages formosus]XP_029105259.1 kinetochore protein NDC80 homolog [Scleropages formosus]
MNRVSGSRQSVLPQRVSENRTSLVNATPQSKDSAFGKLNIPKPQSGTSDRRTSFFGKRFSGAGMPRNSTFGTFGGTEKVKDPRPLHDKSFIQQCIKHLCEFLSEQGFPGTVSIKSLQSPSTKEFLKIFEFIYTLLDPTFQMPTSKIEEEIPRILRDIGYPFALPKSSMYSVGAPHTWPQVLGALIWLIDTVKLFSNMKEKDLLFSDFPESHTEIEEGLEFNKLFLDYTAETYNRFMQGADVFEEEDREYIAKLKKLYNVDEVMLESLAEKHRILSEEAERLEKESQADRLMAKRTEKLKRQTDLQKLQSYRSNLESFKSSLETKAMGISEDLEAIDLQMETLRQEKERLQHILLNQKFSPADIERINRERNELQQTINSLTLSLEEAEQHMWNEEIALAKVKEEAEMELAEYHNLARKLKLIPTCAENACGRDFEIKITSECGPSTMAQYKVQILNPLHNMISEVEEEISILSNKKLSLEEAVEQVRSNITDKMNDLKDLKEQIGKLDEQLEQDMQETAREEEKWAAEMKSMENHKKLLEKKVTDGYDNALEQLTAAQQQYHLVLQETNEQRRSVVNNLHSLFTTAADHLSIVEKFLDDQHKRMNRVYKKSIQEADTELKELKEMVENYIMKADAL